MTNKKNITEKDLEIITGGLNIGENSPYDNNFMFMNSINDSRAINNTLYVFVGRGTPNICLCCGQRISSFGIPCDKGLIYDCFSDNHSILVEEG